MIHEHSVEAYHDLSEPLVCAILLTKDRPEMAARAVRAFREQTYQNKRLYVYDTGKTPCTDSLPDGYPDFNIIYHRGLSDEVVTIGMLRNRANWWAVRPRAHAEPDADIIATFDDDDVSHPNRIAEQVEHLQSSGADVVGYNEILFWRMPNLARSHGKIVDGGPGQAWIWKNAQGTAGSSFAYWRKTWEQKPFPDQPRPGCVTGEDYSFVQGLNFAAVSGIPLAAGCEQTPRLVASIHGGNTSSYDLEGMIARGSREWRRAPEFDNYARKVMVI